MKVLLVLVLLLPVYCFAQSRYDVVIDEIMADPTPPLGLPNSEWIELKNASAVPIDLLNWRIADGSGQSGPFPSFILQPDSFVILCSSSSFQALSAFGRTLGLTGFPSLDNDGEILSLKAPSGLVVHALRYSSAWYDNELKKDGGWSLEMIDPRTCSAKGNWKASIDLSGGTPGKINSIDGPNPDHVGPRLQNAFVVDDHTLTLVFDETLDSAGACILSGYAIDGGISIASALPTGPLFDQVQLTLNNSLAPHSIYEISVSGLTDCSGNIISSSNSARIGMADDPRPGDWIINEILFDPRPGSNDYVEFLNTSDRIFDASRLYMAGRSSNGALSTLRQLSAVPLLVFPGDYIAVTEDAANLTLNYLVRFPEHLLAVSSMPSFPDDRGTVVAINFQGEITDEISYDKAWHFKLIADPEGVSLERIDPAGSSQSPANWHSAASTAGYGTPTYKNSQQMVVALPGAAILVSPATFSPDNDGRDDVAMIQYKMESPGFVGNVAIFDAAGRPVRRLVRNAILGLTGYWSWDGLDDKSGRLPAGPYVALTEVFSLNGRKQRFKNVIVLARSFR